MIHPSVGGVKFSKGGGGSSSYWDTARTATPQPGRLKAYPSDALPAMDEFCGVTETMPG